MWEADIIKKNIYIYASHILKDSSLLETKLEEIFLTQFKSNLSIKLSHKNLKVKKKLKRLYKHLACRYQMRVQYYNVTKRLSHIYIYIYIYYILFENH
jgi:hypothetical protein